MVVRKRLVGSVQILGSYRRSLTDLVSVMQGLAQGVFQQSQQTIHNETSLH